MALLGAIAISIGGLMPWWKIELRPGVGGLTSIFRPGVNAVLEQGADIGKSYTGFTNNLVSIPLVAAGVVLIAALGLLWGRGLGLIARLLTFLTGVFVALACGLALVALARDPINMHLATHGLSLDDGVARDAANSALRGTPAPGLYLMLVGGGIAALAAVLPTSRRHLATAADHSRRKEAAS